jgi:hypothetical protein
VTFPERLSPFLSTNYYRSPIVTQTLQLLSFIASALLLRYILTRSRNFSMEALRS